MGQDQDQDQALVREDRLVDLEGHLVDSEDHLVNLEDQTILEVRGLPAVSRIPNCSS